MEHQEEVKELDQEKLAGASIEELEAMAAGGGTGEIAGDTAGSGTDDTTGEAETKGEQAVEEGAAAGAPEGTADQGEGGNVASKSGKGTIPYAVLQETRNELADVKRQLKEQQESRISTTYKADIPEDHAAQMEAVQAELNSLGKRFESGDISWEEYQAQLSDLTSRRESLLADKIKSQISTEMQAQNIAAAWESAVVNFIDSKPDGLDYNDPELNRELDTFVRMLGQDPANNDKDFNWFLDMAHRAVLVRHNVDSGKKQPTAEEGGDNPSPPPPAAKAPNAPINSLSDIPGGQLPAGNETEQLTGMSGAALTNRFMNDPKQIDKVLASLS